MSSDSITLKKEFVLVQIFGERHILKNSLDIDSFSAIDTCKCISMHSYVSIHVNISSSLRSREGKISVQDVIRFHHFEEGTCSCSDFW